MDATTYRLGDTLDVVTEDLTVTLRAAPGGIAMNHQSVLQGTTWVPPLVAVPLAQTG